MKAAAEEDSTALVGLSIVVETRTGQRNSLVANRWFAYKGGGSRPFNRPFNLVGYRAAGVHTSITLRWLYTDSVLREAAFSTISDEDEFEEDFFEPASGFSVDQSTDEGKTWFSLGISPRAQTKFTLLDKNRGIYEFFRTLPGFERTPYWFRIAGRNTAGTGVYSMASPIVTETCEAFEFL